MARIKVVRNRQVNRKKVTETRSIDKERYPIFKAAGWETAAEAAKKTKEPDDVDPEDDGGSEGEEEEE